MLPDGNSVTSCAWRVPSGSIVDDEFKLINAERGIEIAFDSVAEELTVYDQLSHDGLQTTQRRRQIALSSNQSIRSAIDSLSPENDAIVLDVVETDREGLADVVYVTRAVDRILEQADVDTGVLVDAAYGTPESSLPTTSAPADIPPVEIHITTVPTHSGESGSPPQQ